MTKKQHYMTYPERVRLETMLRFRVPVTQIARELGCCRQTVYNEMKRGEYGHERDYGPLKRYSADKGQDIHRKANRNRGRNLKIGKDIQYANFLEQKILVERYSPAAALAAARKTGFTVSICVGTCYSYIEQGVFYALTNNDLWEKPRRRKKTTAEKPIPRVAHKDLPSIEQRPKDVWNRLEPGHWEMDLILGIAGTTTSLLTLTERLTREEIIIKIPNRKSATIVNTLDQLEQRMGKQKFCEKFHSISTDNGPEFLDYEGIRQSIYGGIRCKVFYCHSWAAWEKGTNERNNRIIRRWFPKGTDFTKVSPRRIKKVQDWMNNYPRKILGWLTPLEAAA